MAHSNDAIRLRVLTLNFFLRPPGVSTKGGDWKFERLRLFAQTQFSNYDVICLQETFASLSSRRNELIQLANDAGLKYISAGKKQAFFLKLRVDAGLIVLSRFPIVESDEITFRRGTEIGDWLAAKGVLYTQLEPVAGRKVHVFSTHFQSTDSPKAIELRLKQYHEAKQFIDRKLNTCGWLQGPGDEGHCRWRDPVIFCGDMNVDARANGEDGVGHGQEYLTMMDIYSGKTTESVNSESTAAQQKYELVDVCYKYMKEHPITTSRLCIGPGLPEPDKKCIDFIIGFQPIAPTPTTTTENPTDKHVAFEHVRIEKFVVDNQPFSFLSDHFGVAADLVLQGGATSTSPAATPQPTATSTAAPPVAAASPQATSTSTAQEVPAVVPEPVPSPKVVANAAAPAVAPTPTPDAQDIQPPTTNTVEQPEQAVP
ncbi:Endonuclease/exonuclease/phosphatase [Phlyctochytrium arcticum]|nr:Endonuclease/exonuclease/phosphatase [Phlyctochytrium arcticum]